MTYESLRLLRFHIDRGRHTYRNFAIGAYLAGLVVVGITIAAAGAEFYSQGPMVLVGILALVGALYHAWYWRLGWSRHPVLIALETSPDEIVRAHVVVAQGKAALLNERQVVIGTEAASVMLTIERNGLEGLGEALRVHCPQAVLTGFPSD